MCPLTPCGTKYRIESRKWYAQYNGIDGKVKRRPAFTDKSASLKLAEELEKRATMRRMGCATSGETLFELSMTELIERFAKYLQSKNNTPDYCKMTEGRIRKLCEGAEIRVWGQITPSKVLGWLSEQREANAIGVKTSNYYLVAIKELCNWAVNESIALDNPLRSAKAMNAEADVRRRRRAISADEFSCLVEAARKGSPIQGMSGPERALLYVVAAWTGFRRSELASLTVSQLQLNGNEPTITVSAAYSKRRRRDVIPLHVSVAALVQSWLEQNPKAPGDPVFAWTSSNGYVRRTSKMMAKDLEAARNEWISNSKDENERAKRQATDFLAYESNDNVFADFHANRHTFITNLGKSGVSPKLAQTLARHSDIRLTFDVYTHVDQSEESQAVSTLPSPPSQPIAVDSGKEGDSASIDQETPHKSVQEISPGGDQDEGSKVLEKADNAKTFALQFAQTIRGGCLLEATEGTSHPKGGVGLGRCETNESPVICNDCQQMTDKKESGQGRDRTGDTRIFSPYITSDCPHHNSLTPKELSTRNHPETNFVCTTVCTNDDSLHDIEWQRPSSIGRIVDAWPHLPPHIRETILTLVDSVPCRPSSSKEVNQPSVQLAARNCPDLDGAFKDTISRTLLKALRHCPELYGLNMDSDGWVSTVEFGRILRQHAGTTAPNAKQLQQLFRDIDLADRIQTKPGFVRAAYGHSTDKFAPSISAVPDKPLYHGTSASNWAMIKCFGLSPVKLRYVQLTTDFDYARQIANSHGRSSVILKVSSKSAIELDVKFYPTQTHVWQATAVPAICLQSWLDNTDALEEPLASPGFPKQCEFAPQLHKSFNN